ncbi:NADH dehydrogenase [Lysobacter niabensis]|uniref:NADH dehydrogenase n=1 Tax=Agrilutibacter niabensis TaxID=380628 RepID=A0ABU1VTL8_9GAMM|nr:NAD-dependent epimerase/dehydratase family protein [Lysobacter niabensis]MDR7100827.1 NADH dehydrogenase [Lysobacter niabensis]
MTRTLGVTGASGYIGQALLPLARAAGWQAVALGRRNAIGAHAFRHVDLGQPLPEGALLGLDAVVHLAADTTGSQLPQGAELAFAKVLGLACRELRIPLLVVSSQAAALDAPSHYGRTKAEIEMALRPLGAIIVRPGQVVGGREAGLFGLLVSLVRTLPVVPMLLPRPHVQPVHIDDLAAAILAAIARPQLAGECIAVADEPICFDELLMQIAHYRLHRRRVRVPVPVAVLRFGLAVAHRLLGPRLSPERLDSLTRLPALDAGPDLRRLGIVLRPLAQALGRRSSARRVLLQEGRTLTCATVARPPGNALLRRYARLMPLLEMPRALDLPASLLMCPAALAALDVPARRRASQRGDLSWRMDVVSRLAEADLQWADAYLPRPGRAGWLRAGSDFARAGIRELQVRLLAPWANRIARVRK